MMDANIMARSLDNTMVFFKPWDEPNRPIFRRQVISSHTVAIRSGSELIYIRSETPRFQAQKKHNVCGRTRIAFQTCMGSCKPPAITVGPSLKSDGLHRRGVWFGSPGDGPKRLHLLLICFPVKSNQFTCVYIDIHMYVCIYIYIILYILYIIYQIS